MSTKYILMNIGNPEACHIDNSLDEVREGLRFMYEVSFKEVLDDDDVRLEDTFYYISKSRFNAVSNLTFEELKAEYYNEFNWGLVELENRNELVEQVNEEGNVKVEIINQYIDDAIAEYVK